MAFESKLNELCGVAAVPIYIQHYLGIKVAGNTWQQTLAAAMHSRIRAIQQQSLPPVVIKSRQDPLPLLPTVAPTYRLPAAVANATPALRSRQNSCSSL